MLTESKIPVLERFLNLQLPDIRQVGKMGVYSGGGSESALIPLFDEKILGAFKVERLIRDGCFLGAKQYAMHSWEGERVKD